MLKRDYRQEGWRIFFAVYRLYEIIGHFACLESFLKLESQIKKRERISKVFPRYFLTAGSNCILITFLFLVIGTG